MHKVLCAAAAAAVAVVVPALAFAQAPAYPVAAPAYTAPMPQAYAPAPAYATLAQVPPGYGYVAPSMAPGVDAGQASATSHGPAYPMAPQSFQTR